MSMRFTHTRLLVPAGQFGATCGFYRDTLGLTPVFPCEGDDTVYAEFRAPGDALERGHVLALFRADLMAEVTGRTMPAASVEPPADRVAITFEVDSVDQAAAELESRGVALVTQPHDRIAWMIRVAHFRDPAGFLVEINQPLKVV